MCSADWSVHAPLQISMKSNLTSRGLKVSPSGCAAQRLPFTRTHPPSSTPPAHKTPTFSLLFTPSYLPKPSNPKLEIPPSSLLFHPSHNPLFPSFASLYILYKSLSFPCFANPYPLPSYDCFPFTSLPKPYFPL